MEILNTIWTAFTTENNFLIQLQGIPMLLVEIVITMLIFTQLLNIHSDKRKKLIYIISYFVVSLFFQSYVPHPYNTLLNMIVQPILVFFIFNANLLKTILSAIIPIAMFVIIASILQFVFLWILNISAEKILLIPIYRITFSILEYVIIYILYELLKHFDIKITLFDNMHKSAFYTLILNLIIGIFAIAIQAYLIPIYASTLPNSILMANILTLSIYFLISMYSLFRTNNLELTKKNLQEEKLYNKTLNILYDNLRIFKHDFNNIVQAIGGYVGMNNMDGLKKYYSELIDDCHKLNNLTILSPELINNPAIYSLLTSKYHMADELGIKMNIEVFLDLTKVNMKTYELSRVFGILLDNAIEASTNCEKKIINVIIRKDSKANRQLFLIENTYSDKTVDTDKIFEKGFTSKTNEDTRSHGLGLWEVRQILKRNNNLNLHTTKNDSLFSQQLEIYC